MLPPHPFAPLLHPGLRNNDENNNNNNNNNNSNSNNNNNDDDMYTYIYIVIHMIRMHPAPSRDPALIAS